MNMNNYESWHKEHMIKVARRNANRQEMDFRRYLAKAGWSDKEIEYMWKVKDR